MVDLGNSRILRQVGFKIFSIAKEVIFLANLLYM